MVPLAGPLIFATLYLINLPLDQKQQSFLAVFCFVVYNWLIARIPLFATGLIGVGLSIILGVEDPIKALSSFAHPIIFIFLAGFLFAKALRNIGLDRRISLFIISKRQVAKSFDRLLFCLLSITAFFSMWVSNTATTAMMMPILLGVLTSLGVKSRETQSYMLLGLAYSASVGGLATPVGSPPNIIAIGMLEQLANIKITFIDWTFFGVPLSIFFLIIIFLFIRNKVPKEVRNMDLTKLFKDANNEKTLSREELWLMVLFSVLLLAWFLPGLLSTAFGDQIRFFETFQKRMNPGAVGMLMAALLFVFPLTSKRKLLKSDDLRDIDWGSLILFGSGLSLGKILFDTGLAEMAGNFLVTQITGASVFLFLLLLCLFTVFSTELASNTASANILIPIVIASSSTLSLSGPAPVIAVALSCSLAFMLPVATPPNAIVYGSGKVDLTTMMRFGLILNFVCGTSLALVFYFINYAL